MAISLVDSDAVGFGITGAGFLYNFPAGPSGATEWDFLVVNSDALVSTPGGWTLRTSRVGAQGAYFFTRLNAGSSVTLTTPSGVGPFNATLSWGRLAGALNFDVANSAEVETLDTTSPPLSLVLTGSGEAVISCLAGHRFVTAPVSPVWGDSFNGIEFATQSTGNTACATMLGISFNRTGTVNPTVSWTNAVADRYFFVGAWTPSPDASVQPDSISMLTALGEPAVTMPVSPDSVAITVNMGAPSVSGAPIAGRPDLVPALYEKALECLCDGTAGNPNPPGRCVTRVGTEVAFDLGQYEDLCCEGLSYIMLGDMYISSTSFPEQDIVQQIRGQCAPPTWAVDFRLGIVRCVPAGQPNGDPPLEIDQLEAARQNLYDAQSLRYASCCFRNWFSAQYGTLNDGMNVVIGRQVQGGIQGGCIERYVTLTVQFPDIDCGCS